MYIINCKLKLKHWKREIKDVISSLYIHTTQENIKEKNVKIKKKKFKYEKKLFKKSKNELF